MLKVRCPSCQTKYKLPDEARGKKVKCKACGQAFRLPAPRPVDDEPIPFAADELDALVGGESVTAERTETAGTHPLMAEPAPPETLEYASSDAPSDTLLGSMTAYFKLLGHSAGFPIRVGDLVTFTILWFVLAVGQVVIGLAPGCIGLIVSLIIFGWYMSYLLNTVEGAAAGEENLPEMSLTGGWSEDIFIPLFKMFVTHVMALLPCLIFVFVGGVSLGATFGGGGPSAAALSATMLGALGLFAFGYFMWPMFVLVVTIGGIPSLIRFDMMLKTVVKSFPAYLLTVLIVYLTWAVYFALAYAAEQQNPPPPTPGVGASFAATRQAEIMHRFSLMTVFVMPALSALFNAYTTIVAMRAIGLYYHCFKSRFAWSWG